MSSDLRASMVEREPDLHDYLDVLRRRWWVVAASITLALPAALGISLLSPPVYRGTTTIVVDRSGASLGLLPDLTGFSQQTYVDTLAEIIRSRAVAERALDRLPAPTSSDRERVLERFRKSLRVQRVRGADLIKIEAEGRTPEGASDATNAVASAFVSWHVEARRSQAQAGRQFIEGQLAGLTRELRFAEDSLARHKTQGGQVALSEQTRLAVDKLAEFEAQRRVAGAERQGVEASLRQARAVLGQQHPTVPSSFVTAEDPVVEGLRAELAKLETELAGLREQFTDRHPRVLATQARIGEVKDKLRQQAARTLAAQTATLNPLHQDLAGQIIKLEVEQHALQAREAALALAVRRYAGDIQTLPPKEIALARLTRDLKVAEETYLLLSQKLQEARIAEASVVGDARIVDRAVPPTTPVRPRTSMNTLLGALLGLMLGLGAVYMLEALDVTFRTPEEVGQALGLPVLAAVPFWKNAGKPQTPDEMQLVMHRHRRSPFAEAFRHLRTNLLYLSPDRPLRALQVASPGPGEGKTTVSSNLAIALTQTGQKVWLVECDLRKGGMHWAFQPAGTGGLTELLVDGLPVDRALHRTEIEGLWFLPGGTPPPNPAELLGSQKMRAFLEHGRGQADMLVIDSPPLLPVTDAVVLAPMVDGILLVINLPTTPRDAALRARHHLDAVGAKVLGVVVVGVPTGRRGYGYYYRGYYGAESEGKDNLK